MCRKLTYLVSCVLVLGLTLTSTTGAGLVGWWKLDEGSGSIAYDSSGNGNDGTLEGDPQWVAGQLGGALEFDGTDDYLDLPIGSLLSSLTNCSFATWVDFSNEGGAWQRIFDFGTGTTVNMFLTPRMGTTDAMRFAMTISGYADEDQTTAPATLASGWHHVAVTIDADNSTHSLYLDGQVVAENTAARYTPSDLGNMTQNWLGRSQYAADGYFNGSLDDFRIYDDTLMQEQIQAIMLGGGAVYPYASRPDPPDGVMYERTWANISWSAGDYAVSHDFYIGSDFDDVNEATRDSDAFRGNTTEDWFLVGLPGYPYATGLELGTTYYWRVDEVNDANDDSPWKGPVWSFWLPSRKAYNPSPADGAQYVRVDADLSWSPGWDAAAHYVYFGEDYETVKNATGALPQTQTTYDPGTLELEKTYYWRVDEFAGGVTHTGDVWSFTTVPHIAISDPNLLGWWKLDEGLGTTAVDWSGHNYHGSLIGGPQWVAGYDGGGLEFDGTNDYVDLPIGSLISSLTDSTFTTWVNFSNTGGAWQRIFDFGRGTATYMFLTPRIGTDGVMRFAITTSGGDGESQASAADTLASGWHHVAVTIDGSTIILYLDSVVVARAASQLTPSDLGNTTSNWLGRSQYAADAYFSGSLDDFRIYDYALSQDEIPETMRGDPFLAWDPSPAKGSTVDIEHVTFLSWKAGDKAAQHDVYFGTDEAAVANADTSTAGIYRGRQGATSYTPLETLQWGKNYYWRIDEYNTDETISEGRFWSFTVADYLIVEDFESYTDDIDNRIFQTWIDGWGYNEPPPGHPGNGSGSTVGHLNPPFAEQTIVYAGSQSMPFDYNNTGTGNKFYYSETERTWDVAQDWTRKGVKALTLYFRGYPPAFLEEPPGTYTMSADGNDIWDYADQFRYAVKRLTGNGTIEAQVLSVENTDGWAKAGVMIRESLDPRSAFAAVYITPANGCRFQMRAATGSTCTSDSDVTTLAHIRAPHWVKLERAGNTFNAYDSNDPAAEGWHPLAWNPQTVTMPSSVYIGVALTSHNADAICVAEFSDVSTTGSVTGQWQVQDIGVDMPGNEVEQLYLAVEDSTGKVKIINHANSMATTLDTWQEWNIDLRDITGINLTAVKKMYLGVGDRDMPQRGGAGTLYFDDIRLYKPRCVASIIQPEADLSGNCVVDLADIEILSNEWLQSGSGLTADLNADETVDLKDLAEIGEAWLEELLWPQP